MLHPLDYETQDAKQIGQAVAIAALSALATGLINWGIETLKQRAKKREEKK